MESILEFLEKLGMFVRRGISFFYLGRKVVELGIYRFILGLLSSGIGFVLVELFWGGNFIEGDCCG